MSQFFSFSIRAYLVTQAVIQMINEEVKLMNNGAEVSIVIGNLVSDGRLNESQNLTGNKKYDSVKSKAQVLSEKLQAALDNIKENILEKVNINKVTMGVDATLTLLGFDTIERESALEGEPKHISISYYIMSNPLVRELANRMNRVSNLDVYDKEKMTKIYNDILSEIGISQTQRLHLKDKRGQLTGDMLYKMVAEERDDENNIMYATVLELFMELHQYGENINALNNKLNITSSGLGKSFLEIIEKLEFLHEIADYSVSNVDKLLGDFQKIDFDASKSNDTISNQIRVLKGKGYIEIPQSHFNHEYRLFIKPTTPLGSIYVNSIVTSYNTLGEIFPYDKAAIRNIFDKLISIKGLQTTDKFQIATLKNTAVYEFKKFLNASSAFNLLPKDVSKERRRLLLDKDKHKSLATYFTNLFASNKYPEINNNVFLQRLKYNSSTVSKGYTTLKVDNDGFEGFDERMIYDAFVELFLNNVALDDFNGQPYNTNMLAIDLIKSAFLIGGVHNNNSFTKYIPYAYLTVMGYTEKMRDLSTLLREGDFKGFTTDTFVKQYIQNNPKEVKLMRNSDGKPMNFEELSSIIIDIADNKNRRVGNAEMGVSISGLSQNNIVGFKLSEKGDIKDRFIRIISNNGRLDLLFERVDDRYIRIPLLHGEYEQGNYYAQSNVNPHFIHNKQVSPVKDIPGVEHKTKNTPGSKPVPINNAKPVPIANQVRKENVSKPDEHNVINILNKILQLDYSKDPKLKNILQYLIKAQLISKDLTIKFVEMDMSKRGSYDPMNKQIIINKLYIGENFISNAENQAEVVKTIVKELIHHATMGEMSIYMDRDGNATRWKEANPDKDLPFHIVNIRNLFNEYNSIIKAEVGGKVISDVINKVYGANPEALTEKEKSEYYPAINIFEFVEMMFTDERTQRRAARMNYRSSGKSFFTKFLHTINKLFNTSGKLNMPSEVIANTLEIMFKGRIIKNQPLTNEQKINLAINTINTEVQNTNLEPIPGTINNNPELSDSMLKMIIEAQKLIYDVISEMENRPLTNEDKINLAMNNNVNFSDATIKMIASIKKIINNVISDMEKSGKISKEDNTNEITNDEDILFNLLMKFKEKKEGYVRPINKNLPSAEDESFSVEANILADKRHGNEDLTDDEINAIGETANIVPRSFFKRVKPDDINKLPPNPC